MNRTWNRYLPVFIQQLLTRRHLFQQSISNAGWLFVYNIIRKGLGLVVVIWVTRYLGPEKLGLLSYATAMVTLLSSALIGLDAIVVRNIVRNPSCRDETLGSAFVLKIAGGGIMFCLALAVAETLHPDNKLTLMLVAIIAIGMFFQSFNVIECWFQSQILSKYSVYARTVAFVIISGIKIALIFFHAPLTAFAWAGVAEIILGSIGLVIAYRIIGLYPENWRSTGKVARILLRDSWPLMLSEIAIFIYICADKIMIGETVGNTELGFYSVATVVAEALFFIPLAVASTVFPSVVKAKEAGEEFFLLRLQQFYNLMALLAYAVALPVTFLSAWAIPYFFGSVYSKAVPMLVCLVWGGLFINLAIARSQYLTVLNWTRLLMTIDMLGCVLNVAVNYFLIPRYGGLGAAVTSIITYWFVAHGVCFVFKQLNQTGTMMTKAILYPKIW